MPPRPGGVPHPLACRPACTACHLAWPRECLPTACLEGPHHLPTERWDFVDLCLASEFRCVAPAGHLRTAGRQGAYWLLGPSGWLRGMCWGWGMWAAQACQSGLRVQSANNRQSASI